MIWHSREITFARGWPDVLGNSGPLWTVGPTTLSYWIWKKKPTDQHQTLTAPVRVSSWRNPVGLLRRPSKDPNNRHISSNIWNVTQNLKKIQHVPLKPTNPNLVYSHSWDQLCYGDRRDPVHPIAFRVSFLQSQNSMNMYFSTFHLPTFTEKRPIRLILENEIEWHFKAICCTFPGMLFLPFHLRRYVNFSTFQYFSLTNIWRDPGITLHTHSAHAHTSQGKEYTTNQLRKPHQNGRKMTSFRGAMAKLGACVDNELGGSAPHQCR